MGEERFYHHCDVILFSFPASLAYFFRECSNLGWEAGTTESTLLLHQGKQLGLDHKHQSINIITNLHEFLIAAITITAATYHSSMTKEYLNLTLSNVFALGQQKPPASLFQKLFTNNITFDARTLWWQMVIGYKFPLDWKVMGGNSDVFHCNCENSFLFFFFSISENHFSSRRNPAWGETKPELHPR